MGNTFPQKFRIEVSVCFVFFHRFVASCGFTTDVKVWEVCFGKSGEFREVSRAFDLKGHSAGVCGFAFSNDSSRSVILV